MEHDRGLGRPDQKPKSQNNAYLKEHGKTSPGFPTLKPEQSPRVGGIKSPERQALPGVWEVLERRVKAWTTDSNRSYGMRIDEHNEVKRLIDGLKEKGTERDRLIIDLYTSITIQPGPSERIVRELSLEEFPQFRSKVEPMSDDEIREEIHKEEEEKQRKIEESRKTDRPLTLELQKEIPYEPPWDLGAF
jgi:hypothetical protein